MAGVKNSDQIEVIKQQITKAQNWARQYFNADNANDSRLVDEDLNFVRPSFFVEFPQPDVMETWPSAMGRKLNSKITYRLAFVGDNGLRWKFQHLEIQGMKVPKGLHRPIVDLDVE